MEAAVSEKMLVKAIMQTRQEYLRGGMVKCLYDIGSGHCEDFVDDVLSKLDPDWMTREGEKGFPETLETLNFCANEMADLRLLRKWKEPIPQDADSLKTFKLQFSRATHMWIFFGGKHYDAEKPNGVPHFLQLPFFVRNMKLWRKKTVRENESNPELYFLRATIDPEADLDRNFSCVYNAWVDTEKDIPGAIEDAYPDGDSNLRPPRQDPNTGWWCWDPEIGLSSFAFHDESGFEKAKRSIYPYGKHLSELAVFSSNNYALQAGADGEDVFWNGRFVGWINQESSYSEFCSRYEKNANPRSG